MDTQTLMDQNAMLAEQNRLLMDRLSALEARVPAPPAEPPAPGQHIEFPKMLYRLGGKPGQIDHPDHDATIVNGSAEESAAIADGWSVTMPPVPKAAAAAAAAMGNGNKQKK